MLGLGRTSYLADIHNMKKKKKKKKKEGGRGKEEGGGVWISPFMLSSVLDFEGLRASNTLLRTKLSFKIIFLIFIFFLFTFGVLLVDFNTIYWVLLLVFLVTESISVYYQLPWFEMKKRYYIFVKFTDDFIHDSKHTVNSFSLGFYLLQRENYNTRELRYQKYYGSSTIR